MKHQYNLTEQQFEKLKGLGLTDMDFFYGIKEFKLEEAPASKISLYHYADTHGDFIERNKNKFDLIANEIFNNLELRDKIQVAEYIEYLEEGES